MPVTYPGGQPDPQQPANLPQPYQQPYQQPYEQPGPYPPQPGPYAPPPGYGPPTGALPVAQPGPYAPPPGYGPPTGAFPAAPGSGEQRGGKWALLIGGAFLALILVVVGGYFTYQQVFVQTPTEVVEAYLDEATKDEPDLDRVEHYLCKEEAARLKEDLANGERSSGSSGTTVLGWHVTGESISGDTASVFTQFTIKSSAGRTTSGNLTLTLIKEGRTWKICGFD